MNGTWALGRGGGRASDAAPDCIAAVFPVHKPERTASMRRLLKRIGGCGIEVSAAPKERFELVKGADGGAVVATVDGERVVLGEPGGKKAFPRGNMPNAVTHNWMWKAFAESDAREEVRDATAHAPLSAR